MLANSEVDTALRAGSEEAAAAIAAAEMWRRAHGVRKPGEFNPLVLPSERQALLALRRKVAQQAFVAPAGSRGQLGTVDLINSAQLHHGSTLDREKQARLHELRSRRLARMAGKLGFQPCASVLASLRRYAAPVWNEMDDPSPAACYERAAGRSRPHKAGDRLWKPRRWIDERWAWAHDPANAPFVAWLSPRKVMLWQAGEKQTACLAPLSMDYIELREGDTVAQSKRSCLDRTKVRRAVTIIRRCRQCRGCMYARGLHWAHRAQSEELTAKAVHFDTLTLPEEYYEPLTNYVRSVAQLEGVDFDAAPARYRLRLYQMATNPVFKRFVVALRRFCCGGRSEEKLKRLKPLRLIRVAEFGGVTGRFHFHALVHYQHTAIIIPTPEDYARLWAHAWQVDGKPVDTAKGPWVKVKVPKPGQSVASFTRYALKYSTKTGEDPVFARIGASQDYGSEDEARERLKEMLAAGYGIACELVDIMDYLGPIECWEVIQRSAGYTMPPATVEPAGFDLPQRE